jgi:hypothetical protein
MSHGQIKAHLAITHLLLTDDAKHTTMPAITQRTSLMLAGGAQGETSNGATFCQRSGKT